MPETRRFDLLGWFISACFTVLAGAVALTVAVRLIAAIWLWLAILACVAVIIASIIGWLLWWHRRRPW